MITALFQSSMQYNQEWSKTNAVQNALSRSRLAQRKSASTFRLGHTALVQDHDEDAC